MVGSSIGSSIGKPVGFNIDGTTASGGGGGGTTVTYDVSASLDCGVFRKTQYYDSSVPTTYDDVQSGYDDRKVGLDYSSWSSRYRFYQGFYRFLSVAVAQGATIDSAYLKIEFSAGTERTFRISGFDLDNASQPSSASEGAHSNHTAAYIDFTIPADAGVATSPDIKTIVQEVVNRSGWSSGNAMMLGLWMSTTQSDDYNRTFNTGHDSGDTAPKLEITYS